MTGEKAPEGTVKKWVRLHTICVQLFVPIIATIMFLIPHNTSGNLFMFHDSGVSDFANWLWWFLCILYVLLAIGIAVSTLRIRKEYGQNEKRKLICVAMDRSFLAVIGHFAFAITVSWLFLLTEVPHLCFIILAIFVATELLLFFPEVSPLLFGIILVMLFGLVLPAVQTWLPTEAESGSLVVTGIATFFATLAGNVSAAFYFKVPTRKSDNREVA